MTGTRVVVVVVVIVEDDDVQHDARPHFIIIIPGFVVIIYRITYRVLQSISSIHMRMIQALVFISS